jgi:hypothetical protein
MPCSAAVSRFSLATPRIRTFLASIWARASPGFGIEHIQVSPQKGDHLSRVHMKRNIAQGLNGAVEGADTLHPKHSPPPRPGRRRSPRGSAGPPEAFPRRSSFHN